MIEESEGDQKHMTIWVLKNCMDKTLSHQFGEMQVFFRKFEPQIGKENFSPIKYF